MKKPKGFWTKERCKEKALECKNRIIFKYYFGGAYNAAQKNGWLDEVCSHMKVFKKPKGFWTKERCKIEAKKYKTKKDLRENNISVYNIIIKNNWVDELCSHMKTFKNNSKRIIYACEFNDNHVYIGLTNNLKRRIRDHLKNGSVFNHIEKYGSKPKIKQLTEYLNINIAKKKENYFIKKYKKNNWIILNKVKGGSLGSNIIYWDKKKIMKEALKYNSRTEFSLKSNGAYQRAIKYNILNEVCSHMKRKKRKSKLIKWTKERCKIEALKYNSRTEFKNNANFAYKVSLKYNWLDEICSHMKMFKKPNGYWTKERCKIEALKYNSRTEFKNGSRSAYNFSYKNDLLDEVCFHMKKT